LYEAGQHEEEEHDDRDAADHRQQQRVDHGGGDAGPELVLALELVGQATERAVEITAALAGADEAYVNRWERAAMSGERGREGVASLDVGAHGPQRGADVGTNQARSGTEGAGERQPGREEGRHRPRRLDQRGATTRPEAGEPRGAVRVAAGILGVDQDEALRL